MRENPNQRRAPANACARPDDLRLTAPLASIAWYAASHRAAYAWMWQARSGLPGSFTRVIEVDHFSWRYHQIFSRDTHIDVAFD